MSSWADRQEDFRRHIEDLRVAGYEGRSSREERDEVFRRAVALIDPFVRRVLEGLSESLLGDTGRVTSSGPISDGAGGLQATWSLTWPLQEAARNRFTSAALQPVTIGAVFPTDWTHGHLAARVHLGLSGLIAWPLQVTTELDARRQQTVLYAIAEGELHDRIYEADVNWRIMPD